MHALKPNSPYKILNVQIAFPAEMDNAEITDGLNDLFGNVIEENDAGNEVFIADWKYLNPDNPIMAQTRDDDAIGLEGTVFDGLETRQQELIRKLRELVEELNA